jgi:hypothetical protein
LYGCETWSQTVREELKVLESRVLVEDDICEGHSIVINVGKVRGKWPSVNPIFFLVFCMILMQDISAHTDVNNIT